LFGLARRRKDEARARLLELAERMGLSALLQRYPHELSGGEARRVALARTLAPRPRCLLLDEPLTNLDEALCAKIIGLVREELGASGATLIYVTHRPEEAGLLARRVLRMRAGRLVGEETAAGDA
jgi:iron(III) transport system ATP-binding protein